MGCAFNSVQSVQPVVPGNSRAASSSSDTWHQDAEHELAARLSQVSASEENPTVRLSSREVNSQAMEEQRKQVSLSSTQPSPVGAGEDSSGIRKVASSISTVRISHLTSTRREQVIQDVTEASLQQHYQHLSLSKRLDTFGMKVLECEADGNCQFRSMAFNLFGNQADHAALRKAAVAHMRKHHEFFSIFFESKSAFKYYLKKMARLGTWGDELTLRAVVEAYACEAHVLTTESANWHLVYLPENTNPRDLKIAACPKGKKLPRERKLIFLSYISPLHYDAVVARGVCTE